MKKYTIGLFLLLLFACILTQAQKDRKLKKVMELKVLGEDRNGASVAWHPLTKKYYVVMAGGDKSFFGVYDAKGNLISLADLKTGFDVRGLWYNGRTKTLQANGYKDFGWVEYKLDSNGIPSGLTVLHKGRNQPNDQSVGVYDSTHNMLYFTLENTVISYDITSGRQLDFHIELVAEEAHEKKKEKEHKAGAGEEEEEEGGDFNTISLICTGSKGHELGMVNYVERRVVLFSRATGKKVTELFIPKEVPVYSLLNFSYANGLYWFYNKATKKWMGYK